VNRTAQQDIIRIYSQHLDRDLIAKLIAQLRVFYDRHPGAVHPIKTEGGSGRKLNHFSVFHVSHPKSPVLFAGAIEKRNRTHPHPVIRLDKRGMELQQHLAHIFPYRKDRQLSNRVNLILSGTTIQSLSTILESQLSWYESQYSNK
jgi:hypothetical protein